MRTHTIGDVVYPLAGSFESYDMRCFQIFVMGPGRSYVKVNGQRYECPEGSIYMMYPKTHYFIQFDDKVESTHYWIALFDYASLHAKLKLLNKQMYLIEGNQVLLDYMNLCLRTRDTPGFEFAEFPLVVQYFEVFVDFCLYSDMSEKKLDQKVLIALNYIRKSFSENLKLELIAQQANCSSEHLIRLFRKSGLLPPMQLLKEHRMKRAATMIHETSLSFQEIGSQVGIPDPFQFSKSIKSYFGKSPTSLRNDSHKPKD